MLPCQFDELPRPPEHVIGSHYLQLVRSPAHEKQTQEPEIHSLPHPQGVDLQIAQPLVDYSLVSSNTDWQSSHPLLRLGWLSGTRIHYPPNGRANPHGYLARYVQNLGLNVNSSEGLNRLHKKAHFRTAKS